MEENHLLSKLFHNRNIIRKALVPMLLVMMGGVYAVVYSTGGVKFVFSHSMYFPVLLAGLLLGSKGGIFFGILGGIILGPFMPMDVVTQEPQSTLNWLYRTIFFTLIGALSGFTSSCTYSYLKHIQWISRHDPVTRLPNRNPHFHRISHLKEKERPAGDYVLMVLSFDNVTELKSAFGFSILEEAIKQFAMRFNLVLSDSDLVYRTDSEQLAILLEGQNPDDLNEEVENLVKRFRTPFLFNGIPIHVDARLGYVIFPYAMDSPDIYLQKAEAALLVATGKIQDSVVYNPAIGATTKQNLRMLGELKDAISGGQLSMHYQPKIEFATGKLHSVEALIRWNHPKLGNIPPSIFIPRAEQSTLIQLVTGFALDQAMEQMVSWQQEGFQISTAVNISTRNLLQSDFVESVHDRLQRYDLKSNLLELEVTENMLMLDINQSIHALQKLSSNNISISLDDFGTGFSSLQYLHRLPISYIKIDQSFVRKLPEDQGALHIVEAAIMLAHKLGMQTVAEGVETQEVYDCLGALECDIAQGFLFAKPLSAKDFGVWLNKNKKRLLPA